MNAKTRKTVNEGNPVNPILLFLSLVIVGTAPGRWCILLAEDACLEQPNHVTQFLAFSKADPNRPGVANQGLPILGPFPADPNRWSIPCGAQRISGRWCDPEGQPCTLEVVSADLPCEASISPPTETSPVWGTWTLTVPNVTDKWHVVHLRLTDTPPPDCLTPASRDVLIVFRGEPGRNLPPILLGIWGGTS